MLDEARLAALAPDVVVTQEACEVCAISYEQVAASRAAHGAARAGRVARSRRASATSSPTCARWPRPAACPERGATLVAQLEGAAARTGHGAPVAAPRVAVVEWLAPPMLAGHWVPDADRGRGRRSRSGRGRASRRPTRPGTRSRALEPDAVVVAPCGFDLARTVREARPSPPLHGLAPRVLLLDGNAYLNRPGPRLVEAAETIAAWLAGAGRRRPGR